MVSPTKDQLEDSSASDNDLDNENNTEGTSTSQTSDKEPSTFDVIMDVLKKPEGDAEDEKMMLIQKRMNLPRQRLISRKTIKPKR